MSRTRKDRPYWVKSNDTNFRNTSVAYHNCGARWVVLKYKEVEVTLPAWRAAGILIEAEHTYICKVPAVWGTEYRECTLNEPRTGGKWDYTKPNCHYNETVKHRCEVRKYDRREFHRSVRNERRTVTKKLVDEYNASGTIEEDYTFTPHRKNAMFGGGYVD